MTQFGTDDLADALWARAGSAGLIAIDGRSGAGKTSLAARLAARRGCPVIHLEDVYQGWEGLADASRRLGEALASGRTVQLDGWDWSRAVPRRGLVTVPASRPLVVEGCGALTPEIATLTTCGIWLHADPRLRRDRVLQRDGELFVPTRWWRIWAEQERMHVQRDHPLMLADVVLTSKGLSGSRA